MQWPQVKGDDSKALHNLSMFLNECQTTLDSLGYIGELDSTVNMRIVVAKLPFGLRDRWRRIADSIEEDQGKIVKFNGLVRFLDRQARVATNPAFGKLNYTRDEDTKGKPSDKFRGRGPHRSSSYATNVSQDAASSQTLQRTEKSCIYCEGTSHNVEHCFKLANKSIEDRLSYVRNQSLCFGCLRKGSHQSKDCKKRLICLILAMKPNLFHTDLPR